jgi:hypothetical protein
MTQKVAFKESDANRAIEAVKRAGLHISRVVFEAGKIEIFTDENEPAYDWRKGSKLYEA